MMLNYINANKNDADLLISIYNAAFYDDYIRYGECPAYGRTRESLEESIHRFPKQIIYSDDLPIGVISVSNRGNGEYYLGCLCVIPEYQGKGIGTQAMKYLLEYYPDWRKISLKTPADKKENINFYTKKCRFIAVSSEMDGNVEVLHLQLER
ncbi:MAG: acetyltransferase [Herbinix sp.]|jgi:ribosomal protein S18 acetylase RimI-like enzyme|nr:acetyltransferase [Herbinix sp.]